MNDENLGWLEREWAIFWANWKAAWYTLRNPLNYQVGYQCVWVEDRNKRNKFGEPMYREKATWIGVTGQDERGKVVVVKTFFGKPRGLG